VIPTYARGRIYVAGPYTKGDVAVNVARAIEVGHRLMDLGFAPFVPHLSHFQHLQHPRPYEDWMALDLVWLRECDALLRIPGESAGADREVRGANELLIPVFHEIEHLVAFFEGMERRRE
jgi:Domain of unknown function (DUF4406)